MCRASRAARWRFAARRTCWRKSSRTQRRWRGRSIDTRRHAARRSSCPANRCGSMRIRCASRNVLGNLLTNAAKFTGVGGRITLEGGRDGGIGEISVTDSGIGARTRGAAEHLSDVRAGRLAARAHRVRARHRLGALPRRSVELTAAASRPSAPASGLAAPRFACDLPLAAGASARRGADASNDCKTADSPSRRRSSVPIADDNRDACGELWPRC